MRAQFLAYGVEDCFALWCEAAQDQHCFPSYRVNNVTDLLVVKQEVNELRNLDVVDGDLGFTKVGDDQVLLLSLLQFQPPRGYAVDARAGEIGVRKIRIDQNGGHEISLVQVGFVQVDLTQVSPEQVGLAQVG